MEFELFFNMMKKRISFGMGIPEFFRELVAMITDVDENDWDTPKDPSTKLTKENTIRTYVKRGLSKKFAQSIVYHLSSENFIESINSRSADVRSLLADDFSPYDATSNSENIGKKLAECFIKIIRVSAGMVPQSELETQKQQQIENELKNKYGYFLLKETGHCCPFPGCGKSLTVTRDGKATDVYNVSLIKKDTAPEIGNLLALCPQCYATYSIDNNSQISKELQAIKTMLMSHSQALDILDGMPLEKGIIRVIAKIKQLKEKDLTEASLDPKEIKQKLRPTENLVLYNTVNFYVTTYFVKIKEIMMNLDKRGEIDYEEVQDQMKAIYRRLKKSQKTSTEIFNEIVAKIHRVSLQEDTLCQIVVSYFIQSCEVFDAVTK